MKLRSILAAMMLAALPVAALAQTLPIPLFSPSQLQIPATGTDFNSLIVRINATLQPTLVSPSGAVNLISLTGGLTGTPAIIGLQPGADSNAGIQINPNGSGNIILFGQADTGVLQFGSQAMFVPATSLIACPGVPAGKSAPMGVSTTVTGFTPIKDWLGRTHSWPTC